MTRKILLVDDDRDLVQNLERVFKTQGYDVSSAYNASEALRKTIEFRPDLIILDVSMETDTAGFEFVYQIRDKRTSSRYKDVKSVPIIMLTAINQVTNSRFSLNDKDSFLPGISEFLTKPVKIDELLSKVKQVV